MSSYDVQWGASVSGGRGETAKMGSITIARKTFENIEDFIADNEVSIEKVTVGVDMLARLMVYAIRGYAQQKSAGPVAPRQRSVSALAHRIPVQRITGAYFAGWSTRKIGNAHWEVFNDAREAYFIEYGIHQRSRRPILKMSTIDMLRMIQTTRTAERFLASILAPRRNTRGQFQSFSTRLGTGFQLGLTAGDLPGRGAANPNIVGPTGDLP